MRPTVQTSSEIWAAATFATAQLPDARLHARLVKTAATLCAKPLDSIPQAFDDWGQSKGAYRLMENDRVTIESFRDPVAEKAARDCGEFSEVYVIQDTTALSFPRSECTEDLGPVDTVGTRGMLLHSALAVGPDDVAIGLLDQQYWCRDPEDRKRRYIRRELPIEEKESAKWLLGIEAARRVIGESLPPEKRPRLVHVFDREGDIHEVFDMIVNSPDGAVIRCAHNRRIDDENVSYAHQAVRESPLLGRVCMDIPHRKGLAPNRKANLEIRGREVTLKPSSHYPNHGPLDLYLVEIWEPDPPEGTKPLHWLLWTTEVVENLKDALKVRDIYKKRWQIEEVHLVLKSGCRVEDLRFKTAERIAKMVALYAPIAVRIVQLRSQARAEPHAPCTVVLTEEEWHVLYCAIYKKPITKRTRPPNLRQAVLWIGRLGGHLNRKGDGMPGVRALWRGWRDLQLMIPIYRAGKESR